MEVRICVGSEKNILVKHTTGATYCPTCFLLSTLFTNSTYSGSCNKKKQEMRFYRTDYDSVYLSDRIKTACVIDNMVHCFKRACSVLGYRIDSEIYNVRKKFASILVLVIFLLKSTKSKLASCINGLNVSPPGYQMLCHTRQTIV